MLTCSRRNAKSTAGRSAALGGVAGLTDDDAGSTVEVAVVTTFLAGNARVWPAAVAFWSLEGTTSAGMAVAALGVVSLTTSGFPHGKWSPLKGRSVFQTAKTRWIILRMQWPMATS